MDSKDTKIHQYKGYTITKVSPSADARYFRTTVWDVVLKGVRFTAAVTLADAKATVNALLASEMV